MDIGLPGGSDLPAWSEALLLAGFTLLALILGHALVERAAARAAAEAPATSIRTLPLRLARHTRFFVAVVIALYVGSLTLGLPSQAAAAAKVVTVLVALFQCALWGNDSIAFWTDRYQARAATQGASEAAATAFALRFIASLVLWVVLVLLALENVGLRVTTLVAGLGIGGIAVALAAQSVLGDFFASLAIVLDRPFVVGDFIAVGEFRGTVERVGVKTTRVRSIDGEQLVFANSDLVRSRIQNFGRLQERRAVVRLRIEPHTTAEQVEHALEIVRAAIAGQARARPDRVHFLGIIEGALVIEAVYFVRSSDYVVHMDIQQAIHLLVMREFAASGIVLADLPKTDQAAPASVLGGDGD